MHIIMEKIQGDTFAKIEKKQFEIFHIWKLIMDTLFEKG